MRDTPFVLTYAAKNLYDLNAVHEELFGGEKAMSEQKMNLVQYGRLLAIKSQDMIQFLIAAKNVSAGNSDVPNRALELIAGDPEIEAEIEKGFQQIDQAQNELRTLIQAAKASKS
jgi:hypothetical protein